MSEMICLYHPQHDLCQQKLCHKACSRHHHHHHHRCCRHHHRRHHHHHRRHHHHQHHCHCPRRRSNHIRVRLLIFAPLTSPSLPHLILFSQSLAFLILLFFFTSSTPVTPSCFRGAAPLFQNDKTTWNGTNCHESDQQIQVWPKASFGAKAWEISSKGWEA